MTATTAVFGRISGGAGAASSTGTWITISDSLAYRAMELRRKIGLITPAYLAVVLIAACVGSARLLQSTDMPGLAAIELVLLGLPWTLGLGVAPVSRFGLPGSVAFVVLAVACNAALFWWLERSIRRYIVRRSRGE